MVNVNIRSHHTGSTQATPHTKSSRGPGSLPTVLSGTQNTPLHPHPPHATVHMRSALHTRYQHCPSHPLLHCTVPSSKVELSLTPAACCDSWIDHKHKADPYHGCVDRGNTTQQAVQAGPLLQPLGGSAEDQAYNTPCSDRRVAAL
jgi:hypothetical protein